MATTIINHARFCIGDKVFHQMHSYRGVILDVDPQYQNGDEWYEKTAKSRPAKNQPWYRVLVHGSDQMTYVAEQSIQLDFSGEDIEHPVVPLCFDRDEKGHYQRRVSLQ